MVEFVRLWENNIKFGAVNQLSGLWINFETFQEKVVEGSYSKFHKTYFWQYSNQILFESKIIHQS